MYFIRGSRHCTRSGATEWLGWDPSLSIRMLDLIPQMDQSAKGNAVMPNHADTRRRPTGGNPGPSPLWAVPPVGAAGRRVGWREPESRGTEFLEGRDSFL